MLDTPALIDSLSLLEKAALLSGANTWQTRAIPRLDIPAIWMADGPHGIRRQVGSADHLGLNASEPATCFPTAATVANSWDVALAEEIGRALGVEAAAQGVDVLLGPGLNVKRSPLGGRNFEYFSEDPHLSGHLAAAYVRGIQSQGVAATPKHFAVNSQELRRMVSDSIVDERTMREIYLTAFEIVVRESRPWAVMSAYNLINGSYAHEHEHLLQEILRDEWGFDGAVISDWGGSNDAVAAVASGGTIEMPSPGFESARQIVAAVGRGDLAESDLDFRVAELLELVRRVTARSAGPAVDAAAHHDLARRAAADSVVLLRNEDAVLPLAAGTRVALIGDFVEAPRIQGSGSSQVNPLRTVTLRQAAARTDLTVTAAVPGWRRDGRADPALVSEAVAAACDADVVVLALGQPESAESEGLDRGSIDLPADQVALLASVARANPRVVVAVTTGGVVSMPWIDDTAAIAAAYLGGQAGAEGLMDVLTGATAPGGRLAETFPLTEADTPTAGMFPSSGPTAEYREGIYVGYRHYESARIPVRYPFGFGLSYTTFAYADLEADAESVRVTVTNTGGRDGADVPQVYVSRPSSRYERPAVWLAGFAKVRLRPGQSARLEIPLAAAAFRTWDGEAEAWVVEDGEYRISVSTDVRTPIITASVRIGDGDGDSVQPHAVAGSAPYPVDDDHFANRLGRSIPPSSWPVGPLGVNDPIGRIASARSRIARALFSLVERRGRGERPGGPDLNTLFILNGPFRLISKMSGGLASAAVTDAVLVAVNGRPFVGVFRAAGAFVRGIRLERRTRRAFEVAAGVSRGAKGAAKR